MTIVVTVKKVQQETNLGAFQPTQFQSIVGQDFQVSLARMSPNLLFEP